MDKTEDLILLFVHEFNTWMETSYAVESWPDVDTRDRKAVDALARDTPGRALAIEHTLLQPFAGERADTVPFLKTAGRLDRRPDLAEPNWMINLAFKVGAIPKGIDWAKVGQRLEDWFVGIRPTLVAGPAVYEVDQLPFALSVNVLKTSLPNMSGKLFVMRTIPEETVEPVLRTALAAKVPKLAATPAAERVLLLEMDSPIRREWEIGEMIESIGGDFKGLASVSSVWMARTVARDSIGFIAFHLIWPLDQALEHQEWYKPEA